MNLTPEQIADELKAAQFSDSQIADLVDIQIVIQQHRAAGVPFVRIERERKS